MTPTTDLQKLLAEATKGPWVEIYDEWDESFEIRMQSEVGASRYHRIAEHVPAYNARLIAMAPDLAARVIELEAENVRLREGLEFYANPDAWNRPPVKTREGLFSVEYENEASKLQKDRGKIARAALKGGE